MDIILAATEIPSSDYGSLFYMCYIMPAYWQYCYRLQYICHNNYVYIPQVPPKQKKNDVGHIIFNITNHFLFIHTTAQFISYWQEEHE